MEATMDAMQQPFVDKESFDELQRQESQIGEGGVFVTAGQGVGMGVPKQRDDMDISKYFEDFKAKTTAMMLSGTYYNPNYPAGYLSISVKLSSPKFYKADTEYAKKRATITENLSNPIEAIKAAAKMQNVNKIETILEPDASRIQIMRMSEDGTGMKELKGNNAKEVNELTDTINTRLKERLEEENLPDDKKRRIEDLLKRFNDKASVSDKLKYAKEGAKELMEVPKENAPIKGSMEVKKTDKIGDFHFRMGYEYKMKINGKQISLSEEEKTAIKKKAEELYPSSPKLQEKVFNELQGKAMTAKYEKVLAETDRIGQDRAPNRLEIIHNKATAGAWYRAKWQAGMSLTHGVVQGTDKMLGKQEENAQNAGKLLGEIFARAISSLGKGVQGLSR